jgi:hypothetical protein
VAIRSEGRSRVLVRQVFVRWLWVCEGPGEEQGGVEGLKALYFKLFGGQTHDLPHRVHALRVYNTVDLVCRRTTHKKSERNREWINRNCQTFTRRLSSKTRKFMGLATVHVYLDIMTLPA